MIPPKCINTSKDKSVKDLEGKVVAGASNIQPKFTQRQGNFQKLSHLHDRFLYGWKMILKCTLNT